MNVTIHRCSDDFISGVIEEHHYLHRWPDPRSLPFGYCVEVDGHRRSTHDGRPFGAIVFKKLQHHVQHGLFGHGDLPTAWQVLDLARVWVHPELQSDFWYGPNRKGEQRLMRPNFFSRAVSLALKRVQKDWLDFHGVRFLDLPYHIELIVSYCDRQHHHGTGYKAAGFTLWGETGDETMDIYVRRLKRPRWSYEPAQGTLLEWSA